MVLVPGQEVGWRRRRVYTAKNPSSPVWERWEGLSPGPYWKPLKRAESFTSGFAFVIPISHPLPLFSSLPLSFPSALLNLYR